MSDASDRRPKVRAYHLTPDQLRIAYQEPPLNQFFAKLADTRLAMLRQQQQRQPPTEEADDE